MNQGNGHGINNHEQGSDAYFTANTRCFSPLPSAKTGPVKYSFYIIFLIVDADKSLIMLRFITVNVTA
jgi:hypothetical protein